MKCKECKKEFTPERKTQKRCSYCIEESKKPKPHLTIPCEICEEDFVQYKKDQRFCSKCRPEAYKNYRRNNVSFFATKEQLEFLDTRKSSRSKYLRGLVQRDMDESK